MIYKEAPTCTSTDCRFKYEGKRTLIRYPEESIGEDECDDGKIIVESDVGPPANADSTRNLGWHNEHSSGIHCNRRSIQASPVRVEGLAASVQLGHCRRREASNALRGKENQQPNTTTTNTHVKEKEDSNESIKEYSKHPQ